MRFLVSTIDDVGGTFLSYLESNPAGYAAPVTTESDDGWYIDDVRVSGTVPNEVFLSIDQNVPIDGTGYITCSGITTPVCEPTRVSAAAIADPAASLAAGSLVRISGSPSQMPVCRDGSILYRWSDPATGRVLQEFSTDPDLEVAPLVTTSYRLEVACSQDQTCGASTTLTLPVYTGLDTGVFIRAEGTGTTSLRWLTPPLPSSLDPGTAALEFRIYRGLFGGANGRIDADFSSSLPSPLSCLGRRTGVGAGLENVFSDTGAPAPGAGEGLYYLVGVTTRQGLSLGDMTSGPRTTSVSCP
jgi:hypothetical protein